MTEKPFRVTRMILTHAPAAHLIVSAIILLYYILTEPYRGWRFVLVAFGFMVLAYMGTRLRYRLVDRRERSLDLARLYVQLHALTLVLLPLVIQSIKEMKSDSQRQAFYEDAYIEAYGGEATDRRSQLIAQLRILALVAFFGLAIIGGIHAVNEYVTFETIPPDAPKF